MSIKIITEIKDKYYLKKRKTYERKIKEKNGTNTKILVGLSF